MIRKGKPMRNEISRATSCALAVAAMALMPGIAKAEEGDKNWQVRLLGSYVITENGADQVRVNGTAVAGADLATSNPVIPALTVTRFVGDNIGIELFCCFARVDVGGRGALAGADVARATFFAPVVTAQYRFGPRSGPQPYVGAGAQALFFFNERARLGGFTRAKVKTAFGPTLQAGIDVPLGNSFLINADVKKSFFSTDATLTGGSSTVNADNIKLSPWIISAGVGFRF